MVGCGLQVCVEMLHQGSDTAEAFELTHAIVNSFGIAAVDVLASAGNRIALVNSEPKIAKFLSFVQPLVADDEWDTVLRSMVDELFKIDASKQAEKLVQRMKSFKAKIDANIACNKLKAAYLVAVRGSSACRRVLGAARMPRCCWLVLIFCAIRVACVLVPAQMLVDCALAGKMYDEIVAIHKLAVESSNRGVINICEAYFTKNPRKK